MSFGDDLLQRGLQFWFQYFVFDVVHSSKITKYLGTMSFLLSQNPCIIVQCLHSAASLLLPDVEPGAVTSPPASNPPHTP